MKALVHEKKNPINSPEYPFLPVIFLYFHVEHKEKLR